MRKGVGMDHRSCMQEYLRKRGFNNEQLRVFCFNSRDDHIKRALKNFGWIENPTMTSTFYDLKWTYNDTEQDYATLSEG